MTKVTGMKGNYGINVPDIGEGIAEVEIVEWPVKIGDSIEEDDVICVVMTDKASVEIPSPVNGKLVWIGAEAGDMMTVGTEFIRLEVEGEGNDTSCAEPVTKPVKEAIANTPVIEAPVVKTTVAKISRVPLRQSSTPQTENLKPEGGKSVAAPAVRQRARNAGIDLHFVQGTAPANRITHDDLDNYIANNTSSYPSMAAQGAHPNLSVEEIKVIGLRRKIASVMQDTMQRIPHFTYVEEVDVSELESLRQKLNKERREDQSKLTILSFVIKALSKAVKVYPEMSSRYDDEQNIVHRYGATHVGIATQTDNGLVVPVIKHAEALTIWQSAAEVKRLSTAARSDTAARKELTGSTITITSLGPMGGIVTTPVINSPEVAIVGINKIAKRPVWKDGGFIPRDIMNISASFDHRIIDGWEATLFVQEIKGLLENPATLFMEN